MVRLSVFRTHLPATETRALGEYGPGDAMLDVGAGGSGAPAYVEGEIVCV